MNTTSRRHNATSMPVNAHEYRECKDLIALEVHQKNMREGRNARLKKLSHLTELLYTEVYTILIAGQYRIFASGTEEYWD